MSRIGKLPITIPAGVQLNVADRRVTVQGPKGTLEQGYLPEVEFHIENNICQVTRKSESKRAKALHGLYRKLVSNMVDGVSQGFTRVLLINGVGYRAEAQKDRLVLNLGFANPIEYLIPEGIAVTVDGNTRITVSGIDKQKVGQTAAEIRFFRPPEPYKGKGIRYENEQVRRKVGKSGIK